MRMMAKRFCFCGEKGLSCKTCWCHIYCGLYHCDFTAVFTVCGLYRSKLLLIMLPSILFYIFAAPKMQQEFLPKKK